MADRAGFSATDAALEGFEIARREPLTIAVWSVAQALTVLPLAYVFRTLSAPLRAQVKAAATDPAALAAAMVQFAPLRLLFGAVVLAVLAVLYCAVFRTVLRREAAGPGRLRLGRDEARVYGCMLLLLLVTVGVTLAAALLGAVAAGVLATVAPAARWLAVLLPFLMVGAAVATAGVRLSLSPVMTFATGRLTVFGSWRLTRGRFWALFGAYLIAGLLIAAVELAVICLLAAAALPFTGLAGVAPLFDPKLQGEGAPLALRLLVQAATALLSGFVLALQAGAPAEAYRELAAGGLPGAQPPPPPASDLPRFGR